MAIVTTLGQYCTVFLDTLGVQKYSIVSSIEAVLAGDLPVFGPSPYTSPIFVHQIVTSNDPKADIFLRVGNVADLTTIPPSREAALTANQTLYLSTEFTVIYDDIAVASQAKPLIQQRVDNLIADWHLYNEQFLAPLNDPPGPVPPPDHSDIYFPLTTSIVSERTDAYTTAHSDLLAAQAASDAADAAYTSAVSAAATANDVAVYAVFDSQQCSTLLGQFNAGKAAVDAYRNAVNTFVSASITFEAAAVVYRAVAGTPSTADKNTFDAAKTAYDAALVAMQSAVNAESVNGNPTLTALQTNMVAACSAKINNVQIAAQKKSAADQAAAAAATAKAAAAEAEAAAALADAQAYADLLAVCPTAPPIVP